MVIERDLSGLEMCFYGGNDVLNRDEMYIKHTLSPIKIVLSNFRRGTVFRSDLSKGTFS